MTDELIKPSSAGGAAAQQDQTSEQTTTPTEQTQETTKAQPQLVTMEALEEFGNKLVKRFSQSSKDREKAIKQEVDGLRKAMTSAGITPTAEQEAKLRESIEQKLDEPEESQEPPASASDANVEQAIQYMNDQIANVFDALGTTVTKADPEFKALQKAVDESWSDPKGLAKILLAAQQAATVKAARLQQNSRGAAARVVGGGDRLPSTPKLSAREKISKGLKAPFNQGPPPGRTG